MAQVVASVEDAAYDSAVARLSPDLGRERSVAELLGWARELLEPEARRWIGCLEPESRDIAGYQLGWWDSQGKPANAGGKAIRAALVLLGARAAGGAAEDAVPAAVGVELVHAFSLLYDDVMDRDPVRRHRPAAWTVFGTAATLAAADALMSLAFELFFRRGERADAACAAAAALGEALARMARGQALDLAFEHNDAVTIEQCLSMEADKTASLFAASARLGAIYGGAAGETADRLAAFGEHLGRAFQIADDILGIWGATDSTGKPVLSDLRSRKKSAPVVAALAATHPAADQLGRLYAQRDALTEPDVHKAAALVTLAGGRDWAQRCANWHLRSALGQLRGQATRTSRPAVSAASAELAALARFVVTRQH
jgi:geranylgeranyl diphosphate synthase, type I